MVGLLQYSLSREDRLRLRTSFSVVTAALLAGLLRLAVMRGTPADRWLGAVAQLLSLAVIVRCGFLLLFETRVGRRLSPSFPKIIRDILQAFAYLTVVFIT